MSFSILFFDLLFKLLHRIALLPWLNASVIRFNFNQRFCLLFPCKKRSLRKLWFVFLSIKVGDCRSTRSFHYHLCIFFFLCQRNCDSFPARHFRVLYGLRIQRVGLINLEKNICAIFSKQFHQPLMHKNPLGHQKSKISWFCTVIRPKPKIFHLYAGFENPRHPKNCI